MTNENIIKGRALCYLDNVTCSHIEGFARVPNVGERVAVLHNGKPQGLKVVQVTHDFKNGEPFIVVELNI